MQALFNWIVSRARYEVNIQHYQKLKTKSVLFDHTNKLDIWYISDCYVNWDEDWRSEP